MKIFILCIAISFLFLGILSAKSEEWTLYDTENSGLPDISIWSIAIDSNGDKWFGTCGGIAKFDGVDWTVYNTENSGLPNDIVYSIAIESNGDKWFGTSSGAAKFDGNKWTVYNEDNSDIPKNHIGSIAIDSNGNKWFGTIEGAAHFDGEEWTVYDTSNSGLPDNWINSIAIDSNGDKWFGTCEGIAKFDGEKWTVYNKDNSGLHENGILSIAIESNGGMWLGNGKGITYYDGVEWTYYSPDDNYFPNLGVNSIAIDSNGDKWFGIGFGHQATETYPGGAVKFDGEKWTVYYASNSVLPCDQIYSVAIDSNGNKWFGTAWGGVAKLKDEITTIRPNNEKNFKTLTIFPNPFSDKTTISYSLERTNSVRLAVFDMMGNEVSKLVEAWQVAGRHEAHFDGGGLAPGMYFYVLHAGERVESGKIIHIK